MKWCSLKADGLPFLLLTLFYVATACIVPPTGEFPRDDDFDYADTAWHLTETGQLTFSDWPAMTLVTHVFWGALWTSIGGKSYFVLRLSTIAMSFVGASGLYCWGRSCGNSRTIALLIALTFASNPTVFDNSYTFQTDVIGTSLMILLTVAIASVPKNSDRNLLFLSLFAGVAWLARQTAALPFCVYGLIRTIRWLRSQDSIRDLVLLASPLAICIVGFRYWRDVLQVTPYMASLTTLSFPSDISSLVSRIGRMANLFGLSMLPCAAILLSALSGRTPERSKETSVRDDDSLAVIGGTIIVYLILVLLMFAFFDRYMLPLLAMGLMAVSLRIGSLPVSRKAIALSGGLILALTSVSLVTVQTELARNEVFWSFVDDLHERGVTPDQLNAGLEYGGRYRFAPLYRGVENQGAYFLVLEEAERRVHVALFSPLTDFSSDRRYTLSQRPHNGYRTIESRDWHSWIDSGTFFLMERHDETPSAP